MKPNTIKRTLLDGGTSIGTFLFEFSTTGIARIVAEAGAEFAIFDMEHTGWGVETIRMLIATSRSTATVPIVRVPATEYHFIARVLDMGAMGIMVPMVEGAEQARRIVQSAKYPPQGRRGAAFGVAHDDYAAGPMADKIRDANAEVLLIAQVETARGVEDVEAIAAVEGIDVLWIGQADLTTSLGIPGQYTHPAFLEAVSRVADACRNHKKILGYLALDVEDGKAMLGRGFRMLAYGGDLWLYQHALRQGIVALKVAQEGRTRRVGDQSLRAHVGLPVETGE
jgi:2-dehydro-3-deoxyglucarate aldolase/4-hydroxy-2-oxoheptanedioate aldolase